MNTDNSSISGETIDYGPCAFMDQYDPGAVFSSIDEQGRYAYANQPRIALWNLTRLAECLLPLFSDQQDKAIEEAQLALGGFAEAFTAAYQAGLRNKLGLSPRATMIRRWRRTCWMAMAKNQADFTLTFRRLSDAGARPRWRCEVGGCSSILAPMTNGRRAGGFESAVNRRARRAAGRDAHRQSRPFIPRNHLIEAVIDAAGEPRRFCAFEELLVVLSKPYQDQPTLAGYAEPPDRTSACFRHFAGHEALTVRCKLRRMRRVPCALN